MNDRWEYKVIDITPQITGTPGQRVQEALNQLGDDGWELVSALRSNLLEPTRLYLKRRKD